MGCSISDVKEKRLLLGIFADELYGTVRNSMGVIKIISGGNKSIVAD